MDGCIGRLYWQQEEIEIVLKCNYPLVPAYLRQHRLIFSKELIDDIRSHLIGDMVQHYDKKDTIGRNKRLLYKRHKKMP